MHRQLAAGLFPAADSSSRRRLCFPYSSSAFRRSAVPLRDEQVARYRLHSDARCDTIQYGTIATLRGEKGEGRIVQARKISPRATRAPDT